VIPQGAVSLTQARVDTDLSYTGNLNDRGLRCRVNKYGNETMSLGDLSGNVCGLQDNIHGAWGAVGPKFKTSKDKYNAGANTDVFFASKKLGLTVQKSGGGDSWGAGRSFGTVDLGSYAQGTFRLTGKAHVRNGYVGVSREAYLDIAVVGNQSGFMSGSQTISLQKQYDTRNASDIINIDEIITCYKNRPYIQIALTLIRKGISGGSSVVYTMEFSDIKLEML